MDKFCQSCGMPLNDEKLSGTEKDGTQNGDYCIYCYENGEFKQPDISLQEMIEVCVPHMVASGMKENESRSMLDAFLPNLKRWKT